MVGLLSLLCCLTQNSAWALTSLFQTKKVEKEAGICSPVTELCFTSVKEKQAFDTKLVSGVTDFAFKQAQKVTQVRTTLDRGLQNITRSFLKTAQTDRAGVVALDPKTGKVLLLESFNTNKRPYKHTALDAQFSTASLAKVIAADTFINKYSKDEELLKKSVPYLGQFVPLTPAQLSKKSPHREYVKFTEAFAKSYNAPFGWLGAYLVSPKSLMTSFLNFGFNQPLPFDVPVDQSRIGKIQTRFQAAQTAAGLGQTYISPLHAALIAGAIAEDGLMYRPYLIDQYQAGDNDAYVRTPKKFRKITERETARKLQTLMEKTPQIGTTRRYLQACTEASCLAPLRVGAKTGTVRFTKWVMAYAKGSRGTIAIAVLFYDKADNMKKPAALARKLIDFYFQRSVYIWPLKEDDENEFDLQIPDYEE